jgi:general secretion pathway protein G
MKLTLTPITGSRPSLRAALRSQSGFTLLEIMMVVAIIGLLAASAVYMMGDNVGVARDTKVKSDIRTLETQLMVYETQNGFAPTTAQGLKALVEQPNSAPVPKNWKRLLKEIPTDPWGREYVLINPGKHNTDSYDIVSYGKDGAPDTADDIGNWTKK